MKTRVNVLYHHFPHYRRPVLQALSQSSQVEYRFFGGHRDVAGIKVFAGDDAVTINPIGFHAEEDSGKLSISDYDAALHDCDALILIGNPNITATWYIALRARLKGIKLLFWAHGWLRPEPRLKALLRNLYFGLAHRVLVYGERAVTLAGLSGFRKDKVRVIYNSLDFETQNAIFNSHKDTPTGDLRQALDLPADRPVLLAVSRLTDICRYEWMIAAAAQAPLAQRRPKLVFIGDGPSRQALEDQAKAQKVDALFLGAIYDENTLGQYLMAADVVVSPGKVGLTAMHALAFGTPVVTHGDFDSQMPEVEAVEPGISGGFFDYGDTDGLSSAILSVLDATTDRQALRAACRKIIQMKYTPTVQRAKIDDAIYELF